MAINATKNVPVQRVMSFENSPTPLSLFKEDGTKYGDEKKVEFRHTLEELILGPKILQVNSDAVLHDGHAVNHKHKHLPPRQNIQRNTCGQSTQGQAQGRGSQRGGQQTSYQQGHDESRGYSPTTNWEMEELGIWN